MAKPDRYGWLRDLLADRGHMQKDVAKAWGADPATVSRWFKTGEPELTFDRFAALQPLTGVSMDELSARLAERPSPQHPVKLPLDGDGFDKSNVPDAVRNALDRLQLAVRGVRDVLPGYRIHVTIELEGSGA